MKAAELALTNEQRSTLRSWLAAGKTEQRVAFRAQIILAVAEGLSNKAAAARLATRPATVSKWRGRFARYAWPGWRMRRAVASHGITRPSIGGGSLRRWTRRRRPVTHVGTAPCWPSIWAISPTSDLAGAAGARDLAGAAAQLVHQYRSGVRAEGRRRRRALPAASGECRGVVGG